MESHPFGITVKWTGGELPVIVEPTATVKDVKAHLEEATGVFERHQKLIFKGKTLENATRMGDVPRLEPGSRLMLLVTQNASRVVKPTAAPPPPKAAAKRPAGGSGGAARAPPPQGQAAPPAATLAARRAAWAKTGVAALRDMGLEALEDSLFEGLSETVRAADLTGNRLTALPTSLSTLTALATLQLAGNRLAPPAPWPTLAPLARLTALRLDSNPLEALPAGALAGLSRLVRLSLAGCELSALEEGSLACLPRLEELRLSSNRLAALPECLGDCTSLVELDAAGNALAALPASVTRLGRLQTLRLDSNRLAALPGGLLEACASLASLQLHANPLTAERLRELPGYAAFDARRVARTNKQLGGRVMGDSGGHAWSEGADVQQWERWKK